MAWESRQVQFSKEPAARLPYRALTRAKVRCGKAAG
jgi:hypothetical protein